MIKKNQKIAEKGKQTKAEREKKKGKFIVKGKKPDVANKDSDKRNSFSKGKKKFKNRKRPKNFSFKRFNKKR